jgi:hypothetical protein
MGRGQGNTKKQNGKDPHPRRQMNHLRGQIKGSLFIKKKQRKNCTHNTGG